MSFERLRTQQECEKLVGCKTLLDWSNKRAVFDRLVLTSQYEATLKSVLIEDGKDFYYKGLLSLSEAIHSMYHHLFSWATVKAYYSIFYFLRSSLALRGYSLVRNKSIYLLLVKSGISPVRKTHHKYRNDHVAVINIYRDLYGNSDILQSNDIDGINPYEWMMEKRNQINYRQQQFYDPEPPDFLQFIAEKVDLKTFDLLISTYVDDTNYLYCFQPDHASLALPIHRMLLTKNEYASSNTMLTLTQDKINTITALLTMDSTPIQRIQSFISPASSRP